MKQLLSLAAESIAREKLPHAANAIATGTAATVGTAGSIMGDMMGWLPQVGVMAGLAVSCMLFYKTYLEIKLARVQLAKEDRRQNKLLGDIE